VGRQFLGGGYFAETVGVRDYEAVKKYIQENTESMAFCFKQMARSC